MLGQTDHDQFLAANTRQFSLRDGSAIEVRPLTPSDKHDLAAGMTRLSPESRYRRFMSPVDELPEATLDYLTDIDYDDHFAWAAFDLGQPGHPGIAVARYVRDPNQRDLAEPAVAVVDDFQGRGLGTLLLSILTTTALEHGIRRFRASLLADNDPMRQVLKNTGAEFQHEGPGVVVTEFDLPSLDRARAQLLYGMIRNACEGAIARARRVFFTAGG